MRPPEAAPSPEAAPPDDTDSVELRTVGIDIGSSTAHLVFSLVRLERLATRLSSRFAVASRRQLWRSPILLTPYLDQGSRLDSAKLSAFVAGCEQSAGIGFGQLDTGAVLLTGNALERANAATVAETIAGGAGRFVCAAAGHHLEAELAARGAGAVARSAAEGKLVLNVVIGGGSTKFAFCRAGAVLATAALAVGGRLLAVDAGRRLVRVEPAGGALAAAIGLAGEPGTLLDVGSERRLGTVMADVILDLVTGEATTAADELGLWLTEPLPPLSADMVSFSGGVGELLGQPRSGPADFGDLGPSLAAALQAGIAARRLGERRLAVVAPVEAIRATVIGASQFSTQLSGSTVLVPAEAPLPAHGVPVLHPRVRLSTGPSAEEVEAAVEEALNARSEALALAGAVALAFSWSGPPSHARLHALAAGIAAAVRRRAAELRLVVVVLDRDLAVSLGAVLHEEVGLERPVAVTLDELELGKLDFLDLGEPRVPSGTVPVVVKSLLFGPERGLAGAGAAGVMREAG